MAIIVKRNEEKLNRISITEWNYVFKWNIGDFKRDKVDKIVSKFQIVNDNIPNSRAHEKALTADEMIAIYEYMKKVVERT